jgi:hypothetical protein
MCAGGGAQKAKTDFEASHVKVTHLYYPRMAITLVNETNMKDRLAVETPS